MEQTQMVEKKRGSGIGKFIYDLFNTDLQMPVEKVLGEVRKNFPDAKTNKAGVLWYRSHYLRERGLNGKSKLGVKKLGETKSLKGSEEKRVPLSEEQLRETWNAMASSVRSQFVVSLWIDPWWAGTRLAETIASENPKAWEAIREKIQTDNERYGKGLI